MLAVLLILAQVVPVEPPQGSTLRTPLPDPPAEPAPAGPALPLGDVLRLARDTSPDLAVVRERIDRAQNDVQRAWATLQPTLTANGTLTYSSLPNVSFQNGAVRETGNTSKGASIVAAWNLFNFRALPAIQSAYDQVHVARLGVAQQRRELLIAAASTYYAGLNLRALSRVAVQQARATHDHAREADARYSAGVVHLTAALRARIDALRADQEALRAQYAYASSKSQLAAIIDRRDIAFELEEDPQPAPEVRGAFAQLIEQGLRDRPEMAAAHANEQIAARLRTDAWAQFLPTLAVNAGARYSDPSTSFSGDKTSWSATLALTLPLYDGGFRYVALKDAASRSREARAQTRAQAARIEDEVRRAQLDLGSARALREEAAQTLTVARENERLVRTQFSAGTATQVEVSDAEAALFQGESNFLQQRLSVQLSALKLAQAVGAFDVEEGK